MANTYVQYTGNGSNKTFTVTFPYLSTSHVKAYVNGTLTTAYTWATSTTITFTTAPANGATVKIARSTPATPMVDFTDGSTLSENMLDQATRQALYALEEMNENGVPSAGETDPVFLASAAANVTNTKITNWDSAYGWGNHASAGYASSGHNHSGTYEPAISKTTGYAKWNGSAWTFANETYSLSTHNHTGTYATASHDHASTYQPLDADLTSIAGLAGTSGILKKTAANTWTLDTNSYLTSYTETDPVFTAHAASGVTSGKITNWDTAYSWGNHASAGYAASSHNHTGTYEPAITKATGFAKWNGTAWTFDNSSYLTSYSETDPIFVAHAAYNVTNTKISNWDTAYGWGNHANAGYLTTLNLDGLSDVTISTPSTNQVLQYNGSGWVNATISSGGATTLDGLTDVVITTPSNGQVLKFNGTNWVNDTDATGSGGGGSGTVTSVAASVPVGFTISGTPITTTGTLAIAFDTGYSLPTTTKQGQWDTAYGWGNHASAGYATTSAVASSYQPLDGDLTSIAGLAGTSGILTKTSANTWSLDTNSYSLTSHNHSGTYEPAITKATGYAKWTGSAWSFVNETYSLSTHDHSGTYEPAITTLGVSKGGTGVGTLTGIVKGNGTSAFSAATAGTDYVKPDTATTYTATQTFKGVTDTIVTITDSSFDINPANGSIQVVTLTANRTPTASSFAAGQVVLLGIDDGTAYTITWTSVAPTWVKAGGTASAPTLATTGYTWILLWKVGSTIYASEAGKP